VFYWGYRAGSIAVQKQRALIEQQRKELTNLKETIQGRIDKDVRAPIKKDRQKTVRLLTDCAI
jgi:hypothetical protein